MKPAPRQRGSSRGLPRPAGGSNSEAKLLSPRAPWKPLTPRPLQSLGCRDTGSSHRPTSHAPCKGQRSHEAARARRHYRVPPPPWRARVGGRRATTCPQPRPTSGGRKDSQGFGPRQSHPTTTRTLGRRKRTSGAGTGSGTGSETGSGTGSGTSAVDTSRTTGPVVRAVATRLGADASPGAAAPSAARPPPSRERSTPPAPHRGSLRHRGLSGSPAATASQDSCLHCCSHTRGTHLTTPRCRCLDSRRMRDSQCPPDPLPRRAPPPTGKLQAGSGSSPSRFWLREDPRLAPAHGGSGGSHTHGACAARDTCPHRCRPR